MESPGSDRPKCLTELGQEAHLASRSVKSFSTTLNSSPITLAALARECDLTARAVEQAGALPWGIPGVDDLVEPASDVLSKIRHEVTKLPAPSEDSQLVIVRNEAELKQALGRLTVIRTSLDTLLKQYIPEKPAAGDGGLNIRKMPSCTLPRHELAAELGLSSTELRPVTSASSQAHSYMTRRNRQLAQLLHLAIDKGNGPAVLELLQQGADPTMLRPGSLVAPLHRALARRDEYIATLMVAGAAGLDEADPNDNGRTPLMKGIAYGFSDKFVTAMCDFGAQADQVCPDGDSALHLVADSDRGDDTVGILVLAGADPNLRNRQGHTPLTRAVSKGSYQVARHLLKYGADVDTRVPGGSSVIHAAILRKDQAMCDLLIEWDADLNEDFGDHTPLTLAISSGCSEIARSLIHAGADVDRRSTNGPSPLFAAISADQPTLAIELLNRDASLDVPNAAGLLPVHLAARRNSATILRHLVAAGSAVDPMTNDAETPLCIAVKFRNRETVDLLIDVGADVNHRVGPATTVLSLALEAGDKSTIQMLLSAGSDPTALLLHADSTETTPVHSLAAEGRTEFLQLVLDADPNLESKIWPGYTPLFTAVRAGHLTAVKLLVARGADVHARSLAGESVLFVATEHPPVLKFLLGLGSVAVNHRDHYGGTALHQAGVHGRMVAAKMLLKAGARSLHANAVYDSLGDFRAGARYRQGTPAGLARQRGFEEVARFIDKWKYKR
ncbi:related to ankyrin 3 [Cephalotrichum gorgonifer]|uniref:Related to ankyrin 3 n=1 Tax=Cephalotrichum gorgonifer TaxID=2041049 RepID=A0AAE8N2A0_9PEZI|nr:related to ankyrin 3 [Cephalotrichum gorgonifer]